jgi:cytochrome c oxidase assembly protein subunit 15
MAGVVMIIVQVMLGGITRLTGSGLSITEWNVVTGTLPPLSHEQWTQEFSKYRHTPQYRYLNHHFTLADFKFIFFWEWLHRAWARLIGVVFVIPFIIFLWQRRFTRSLVKPLCILFVLGVLQGAVGWIMVASGLTGDAVYVKPVKLALHFLFAMLLLCYSFCFALKLMVTNRVITVQNGIRPVTIFIICLLVIQFLYGALIAGYKTAATAATWPDINGYFIPPGMTGDGDGWNAFIENRLLLHFIHRGLAYLIFLLVLVLTVKLYRNTSTALAWTIRSIPLFLVLLQIVLGITTVLNSLSVLPNRWGAFEWLAQLHQVVAMLLLLALVGILFLTRRERPPAV